MNGVCQSYAKAVRSFSAIFLVSLLAGTASLPKAAISDFNEWLALHNGVGCIRVGWTSVGTPRIVGSDGVVERVDKEFVIRWPDGMSLIQRDWFLSEDNHGDASSSKPTNEEPARVHDFRRTFSPDATVQSTLATGKIGTSKTPALFAEVAGEYIEAAPWLLAKVFLMEPEDSRSVKIEHGDVVVTIEKPKLRAILKKDEQFGLLLRRLEKGHSGHDDFVVFEFGDYRIFPGVPFAMPARRIDFWKKRSFNLASRAVVAAAEVKQQTEARLEVFERLENCDDALFAVAAVQPDLEAASLLPSASANASDVVKESPYSPDNPRSSALPPKLVWAVFVVGVGLIILVWKYRPASK